MAPAGIIFLRKATLPMNAGELREVLTDAVWRSLVAAAKGCANGVFLDLESESAWVVCGPTATMVAYPAGKIIRVWSVTDADIAAGRFRPSVGWADRPGILFRVCRNCDPRHFPAIRHTAMQVFLQRCFGLSGEPWTVERLRLAAAEDFADDILSSPTGTLMGSLSAIFRRYGWQNAIPSFAGRDADGWFWDLWLYAAHQADPAVTTAFEDAYLDAAISPEVHRQAVQAAFHSLGLAACGTAD